MKTTVTVLIAGLLFLAMPMVAAAHDGYGDNRQVHDQGRFHGHKDDRRGQHHNVHKARQPQRDVRRDLRYVKRQIRHDRRHYRSPYVASGVVVGLPHIVFRFDW